VSEPDRPSEDRSELPADPDGPRRGRLVLVATPIGNLGDLSPRAVEALRRADAIACEDTRHTRRLLSAKEITGPRLLAVHEHNEAAAAAGIVALLERGETVALVTDAGTPGISDPGSRVVAAVAEAGHPVECIPGPTALVAALVVSGLPTERFAFEGFLPRHGRARRELLAEVAVASRTTVLYEAPTRLVRTLEELATACGATRRCSVSRELTKRFEETWRGTLAGAAEHFAAADVRGEVVVVVGPRPLDEATADDTEWSDDAVRAAIAEHVAAGMRTRDAVDAVAAASGRPRRAVYALATQR